MASVRRVTMGTSKFYEVKCVPDEYDNVLETLREGGFEEQPSCIPFEMGSGIKSVDEHKEEPLKSIFLSATFPWNVIEKVLK